MFKTLTVVCYGSAWAAYWGGMGDKTIKEFVASCDPVYVSNNLLSPNHFELAARKRMSHEKYLNRIVAALKEYLLTLKALQQMEE